MTISVESLLRNERRTVIAYLMLLAAVTWPFVFAGHVAAPYRQVAEIGATPRTTAGTAENRKLSDHNNGFVPEISEHLNAPRSGWITLWSSRSELGRPAYHISGLSPAYPPTWLLSQLTHDPFRFATILSLVTIGLSGIFLILYCREAGLSPLAGFIIGTSFAASPLFMYWFSFPMFPAVWCWSACALWAITRLARTRDLLGWSALSFSAYSLLMTAYPQPVVFNAYILGGYFVALLYGKYRSGLRPALQFTLVIASAMATAMVLALPVYLDLAFVASESARVAPDTSFFTSVLPNIESLRQAARLTVLSTVPELLGSPMSPDFRFPYDGISCTLPVLLLAIVGAFSVWRTIWGWCLAIGILLLLSLDHSLYSFCVRHLGFNLSRSSPLGCILLPISIIAAHGADALTRRTSPRELRPRVIVAAIVALMLIALGIAVGRAEGVAIRWEAVLALSAVAAMFAAQWRQTHAALLLVALLTALLWSAYPLLLHQDPEQIAKTSALVERVRANTPGKARYAVAGDPIPVLPPNLNVSLGLNSVHSYNSLSPRRYHALLHSLGGEARTFGRINTFIRPDFDGPTFWMSDVSLVLSPVPIAHPNLEYLGTEAGVHLHGVRSRMGEAIQVIGGAIPDATQSEVTITDPRRVPMRAVSKLVDQGDLLEFDVTSGAPSVLILSQKFHRDWQASVLHGTSWVKADTKEVNGVFQGVELPPDARRIRLQFKPWARYAWIAHAFWSFVLILLARNAWVARGRPRGEALAA